MEKEEEWDQILRMTVSHCHSHANDNQDGKMAGLKSLERYLCALVFIPRDAQVSVVENLQIASLVVTI